VLRFLLVFAVAAGLHATWDSVGTTVAYVVLGAISLGLLGYTAFRLERTEEHVPAIAPAG
jgi:uncharacterized membrane protein (UPF0136 family)